MSMMNRYPMPGDETLNGPIPVRQKVVIAAVVPAIVTVGLTVISVAFVVKTACHVVDGLKELKRKQLSADRPEQ